MKLRSTVVTAAVSAAAALTATGITYASAASAPAPQQAPVVAAPAPEAAPPATAPLGGGDGGQNSKGNEGNNRGDEGNGGGNERGNERGNEGNERGGNEGNEGRGEDEGRIQVNERSYYAHRGDCITVISGLGARSLNIRNDTRKTVEVFRGAICDNGAPIATVGPHSSSYGVHPGWTDGVRVHKGVVASFRVIKRHHDED